MIIEKPEVIADGLYNQRQTAEALKVDRHTIARYEAGAEIMKCWKSTII